MTMEDGIILIVQNQEKTYYRAFVEANGVEHYLEIKFELPFREPRIECEWKLQEKVKHHSDKIEEILNDATGPQDFVEQLQKLLREITKPIKKSLSVGYCSALVQHIEDLGWDNVKDITEDFTDMHLIATDTNGRKHTLVVHPTSNFPIECPELSAELPLTFTPQWGGVFSSLKQIHQQFVETLSLYQRFWEEIGELRQKCLILEPDKPSLSAKDYRIALGASSSLLLTIDPISPENMPECRFMGAESAVIPFRERFFSNLQEWNETLSIYENLKNILKIDFPQKNTGQAFDVTLQCGICYEYKLDNALPVQACNELRCGQLFHQGCLVEWIQSVPGAKQSFQTLFGECPYCNGAITVKLGVQR